jgi:capsular exopolysaccharide synthesis family protein
MNQGKQPPPVDDDWAPGDDVDLRYYWNIINRRKWAITGLAMAVGLLTTLIVFAMTPIYRASATLLIEAQQANVVSIEQVYGLDTRGQDYRETQFEILGARPLAERVVDGLRLFEKPEFRPDDQPPLIDFDWRSWLPLAIQQPASQSQRDPRESAVESYLRRLSIEPVRNTQLVRIQFESANPKLAATVANAHAKAYIDSTLDARVDATKSATEWMAVRVESLRQELLASEAALQAYREQERLVDVAGLRALPAQQINDLSARLLEVRQTLAAAEIAYLQVTPAGGKVENLQSVPAILADEGMRSLQAAQAAAQREVAVLQQRYGPSHPRMLAAQADLARATENLSNQARSVTESIKKRYEAAKSEEAAILSALYRARQEYQNIGRKESKLDSLQRAVDTNRQLYELFYKRLSETSATGDLETAQARVVEPAMPPRFAAKPLKRLIVAIAVLLTLLVGVGVAFLLASLDNTVKSSADVEERLKRPLLGMVPLLKGKALRAVSTIDKSTDGQEVDPRFAEAMRTIRTAISLDNLDKPHKIVLITSAVAGEGKSLIALNLAAAFARSEKTLLVDADMRRPSISKMLALPRAAPGLSELLASRAGLAQCLVNAGVENLDVLATGFTPADPLQLLSSARMAGALKVLANHYSRIIIDCPPILPVSDAAVLSKYAGAVIFVVQSDATAVPQIRNGLGLLERVNAPITGIVLTRLDSRKAEKYSDYGYGGYYEPYASKSEAA